MQVHSTCECWDCGSFSCVQVMNCNCLTLVFEIANNALHQDVKQPSHKDIVCRISHDMELEVQCDLADLYWNILRGAQHLVDLTICRLHAKLYFGIIN